MLPQLINNDESKIRRLRKRVEGNDRYVNTMKSINFYYDVRGEKPTQRHEVEGRKKGPIATSTSLACSSTIVASHYAIPKTPAIRFAWACFQYYHHIDCRLIPFVMLLRGFGEAMLPMPLIDISGWDLGAYLALSFSSSFIHNAINGRKRWNDGALLTTFSKKSNCCCGVASMYSHRSVNIPRSKSRSTSLFFFLSN